MIENFASRLAAKAASLATIAALALFVASTPAHATTSLDRCALGTDVSGLKGAYATAIEAAEERYAATLSGLDPHTRARARRVFAAGLAAYVYGLPQVTMRATVKKFLHNAILSVAMLADPSFRAIVTPNNDTAYTLAWFDLLTGPLVIDVPEMGDRYYVLQLLDAYSNSFEYIGRRLTGTKPGSYALVPPGWSGTLPAGVKRIEAPTNTVAMAGRTVVNGEADMPTVKKLISEIRATPLALWSAGVRQPTVTLDEFPPTFNPTVIPTGAKFIDALNRSLTIDPPPAADACALAAMGAAGVSAGARRTSTAIATEVADIPAPVESLQQDRVTRAALDAAISAGPRLLDEAAERLNAASRKRNQGWQMTVAPWLGEYGTAYLGRAVITRIGFGANGPAEAVYPIASADRHGNVLDGSKHRYLMRFRKKDLPPVGAFWSLTLYGANHFMYENEIKRYSIGDRTPGLVYGRDGSLTVYLQHERPKDPAQVANWLPAPSGQFRLVMRLYQPRRSVLKGRWKPAWVKPVS